MLGNLISRHDAVRLGRRLRLVLRGIACNFLADDPDTGLEAGHVTATRASTPARLGYDAT